MDEKLIKYEPLRNQLKALSVFKSHDYDISITDACKEAGIVGATYYTWFDMPGFAGWWKAQAEAHLAKLGPRILANLCAGAQAKFAGGKDPDKKPDAALIKLFLERFDRDYEPKQLHRVVAFDLTGKTPEELQRLEDAVRLDPPPLALESGNK